MTGDRKPGRPVQYPVKLKLSLDVETIHALDEAVSKTGRARVDLIRESVKRFLNMTDPVLISHKCKFCKKIIDPQDSENGGFAGVYEQDRERAMKARRKSPKAHYKAPWFTAHWSCFYNDESGKNLCIDQDLGEINSKEAVLDFIANLRTSDSDWVFLTDWQQFLRRL